MTKDCRKWSSKTEYQFPPLKKRVEWLHKVVNKLSTKITNAYKISHWKLYLKNKTRPFDKKTIIAHVPSSLKYHILLLLHFPESRKLSFFTVSLFHPVWWGRLRVLTHVVVTRLLLFPFLFPEMIAVWLGDHTSVYL